MNLDEAVMKEISRLQEEAEQHILKLDLDNQISASIQAKIALSLAGILQNLKVDNK